MTEEKAVTWIGIIGNSLLFVGKLIIGIMYNSIAVISDALNSFTDIITSFIVHLSIIVSHKRPDKEHQFGHKRAQPIAALVVAIFIGIVGFEVIVTAIRRILEGGSIKNGYIPIYLLIVVIITKILMYLHAKTVCKKTKSTALDAFAADHFNDFLISFAVLIGLLVANLGYPIFDPLIAIIIGMWIIKAGYDTGMDNIKYLMGEAPSEEMFENIEKIAKSVKGVLGLNDIRAHYVGTRLEAEVHIYVDKKMNIEKAHTIGKKIQKKLERLEEVERVFVHIDPFEGEFRKERKF
jgi:cation diffusion facilitator family transporter